MMTKVFGLIVMVGGLILSCSGAYTYHEIVTKKTNDTMMTPLLLITAGCSFTILGVVLILLDAG